MLGVQLATWSLTDRATANTLYPDLVLPWSAPASSSSGGGASTTTAVVASTDKKGQTVPPVLSFKYEWRPLNDSNVDMRIGLDIQPVQLILHAPVCIASLMHSWVVPRSNYRVLWVGVIIS